MRSFSSWTPSPASLSPVLNSPSTADQGCTQVIGNYISDETGLVTLPGLLIERIYYMKETKAAGGYHPLSAIFTVKLLENPEKLTENVLEDGEVVSKTYRTGP